MDKSVILTVNDLFGNSANILHGKKISIDEKVFIKGYAGGSITTYLIIGKDSEHKWLFLAICKAYSRTHNNLLKILDMSTCLFFYSENMNAEKDSECFKEYFIKSLNDLYAWSKQKDGSII